MSVKLASATLEVYDASNQGSTPDATIPDSDVDELTINSRLQNLIDTGRIVLDNARGQYSGTITSGDRLRLLTKLEGEASESHRWTGVTRPVSYSRGGGLTGSVEVRVDDFVFGVLDMRNVNNGFEETQIAGTSTSILEKILSDNVPEIDQSKIEEVTTKTSVIWNHKPLLEAVRTLGDRGDAIVGGVDRSIVFKPFKNLSSEFEIDASDKLGHQVHENDDQLANSVRVEGGQNDAIDDEQATHSSTQIVTTSNSIHHQISTRKSELTRIQLWIEATGSGESVSVRLQKDDAGSPIAPNAAESDIASKVLPSEAIVDGAWNTFLLPNHTLPEPNPWLIIEGQGQNGQKIGTDGNGTPAYRAYYPYPLDTFLTNQDSVEEYRRRDEQIVARQMQSRQEVSDVAKSAIRHNQNPEKMFEFPADSVRASNLKPGDMVDVNEPLDNAVGSFVVMEKRDTYRGTDLETTIVAQDIDTV